MKTSNIKLGFYDFGPSYGQKTLQITFSEGTVDNLYADFKEALAEFTDAFIEAINGSQITFLSFVGGVIEKTENADEWAKFVHDLSKESLDLQKTPDVMKTNMGQLRPPFMIFIGKPRVTTGTRDFYQNFNVVLALISKDDDHSDLALQEMMNHQYSSLIHHVEESSEISDWRFPKRKISIYDQSSSASEKTLSMGYRYYPASKCESLSSVWTDISG